MEFKDWITIAAILLSPVFAVSITLWYQKRANKKDIKEDIFFTLMENRSAFYISQETVQALNSIDFVFQDDEKIINLWSAYYDSLNPLNHDPVKSSRLYIDLLSVIASHLGYKKLTQMQIDKFYTPQMHIDQVEQYRNMSEEFSRVLKASDNFGIKPRKSMAKSLQTRSIKKTV